MFGLSTTIIAVILFGLIAVGFMIYGFTASKNEMILKKRLNEITKDDSDGARASKLVTEMSFTERTIYPYAVRIYEVVKRFLPKEHLEKVEKDLIVGGKISVMKPQEFIGVQILAGTGIALGSVIFNVLILGKPALSLVTIVAGLAIGFFLPKNWINKEIKERKTAILKSLPFTLDLLNISVEAGLGFDSAMRKVADNMDGPIQHEFEVVLGEISVGKSKREALRNMAERTDVPDLNNFIVAVLQADKLGLGLSRLLKSQSEAMRLNAKQRAQEKAAKAPIKMLIPMVMFIFPAIFIVLLGPAALVFPEMMGAI